MPYCTSEDKRRADLGDVRTVGQLTYKLQQECQQYLLDRMDEGLCISYTLLAGVRAALIGALKDFEDRVVTPYEMCKAAENGDVWDERILKQVGA